MKRSETENILELAKTRGALVFGDFLLSSGIKSTYYFDGRLITLDAEGSYYVAKAFLSLLKACQATAVAGPTLGADPIVSSVATISYLEGWPIQALIVRKEIKQHGGMRVIEGPVKPGMRVAVVDDTCTTGTSLMHAIETIENAGCEVVKVLSILDRKQGGSDAIRRKGYEFISLLEASDHGQIVPVDIT